MKQISNNLGNIYMLFVKGPHREVLNNIYREIAYYISDNRKLLGLITIDTIDHDFSFAVFKRHGGCWKPINFKMDFPSEDKAANALQKEIDNCKDTDDDTTVNNGLDLFGIPTVTKKEESPIYAMLRDTAFLSSAKAVIEEISPYIVDRDGNFENQFQSKNGFDARIWELYLTCFLREENFNLIGDYDAPDFVVEKLNEKVAIEATIVGRKNNGLADAVAGNIDKIFERLDNEVPLKFGSALYSKLTHEYHNKKYWELPHVKGLPFVIAIEDFHEDLSMTWTFPGIISILYGIVQSIENENGELVLKTQNGRFFDKGSKHIVPLFLDKSFENISAVIFSATGTLSKFNRMGKQAGLGDDNIHLLQTKCCYNDSDNAIFPNFEGVLIDEHCHEKWSDGVSIFHNPLALHPLDQSLFPDVAHHFYHDGQLYSSIPKNFCMSSMVWNIKTDGENDIQDFVMRSKARFDSVTRQWNAMS